MFDEFKEMLEHHSDLKQHLFVRGFLLSDDGEIDLNAFPFYGNWQREKLGDNYYGYVHFKQSVHYVDYKGKTFFLFGHAYNPFTMETDEEIILKRIAEGYGTAEYQDRIDEMTGVFVYGVIINGEVQFLVDPSGMQSACYGYVDNHFYMSSHSQLIGDLCELTMSDIAKKLVAYKWYYRVMGPYMPADLTQFESIKRIVPNISYTYSKGSFKHKRFYPLKDLPECKNEEEYNDVIREGA